VVQEVKFRLVSSPELRLEGATFYLYTSDKMSRATAAKLGCNRVLVRGSRYVLEKQKCFKSSKTRTWGFHLVTSICKKQNNFGYCRFSSPLMNFCNSVNKVF